MRRLLQGVLDATFQYYMHRLQDIWMDEMGDMWEIINQDITKKAKAKMPYLLIAASGKQCHQIK